MKYFELSITKILKERVQTTLGIVNYYRLQTLPKRELLSKTKRLKNAHKTKKTFVFGNGPSINKLDPKKVIKYQKNDYHVIAVNSFLHSKIGKIVKPDYQVFSDPLDFEEFPKSHSRYQRSVTGKIDKQKAIDRNITIFAPLRFSEKTDYKNIYYFCDFYNRFSNNVANITKPRGYKAWTGMKALAIACFLGYKKIYICGMDYDMFKNIVVDENNNAYWTVKHFYVDKDRPNYVLKHKRGTKTVGKMLYDAHFNFIHHEKFQKYPIINLDKEGLIDAFPKKHGLNIYK